MTSGTLVKLGDITTYGKFHFDHTEGFASARYQYTAIAIGKRIHPQRCIALPCML
jgi:hypothetical protein